MASVTPLQAFPDPETGAGATKLPPLQLGQGHQGAAVIGASKPKLDPRRALAQFRKKDPNAQGSVRLDTLPPNLRAVVSEFDDGDGEINLTELAATLSALQSSRKSAKHYARLACIGGVAGIVMMLIILGLTFLSVKLATPTGVKGGSLVVAGTNDPVRVASAEFEVKDGSMKQRDGTAVTTAQASVPQKLDSQLPDSYFNELRFIELKSPNGANLHLDVTARARVPKKISAHGNIIQLITPVGTLTLDGEIMSFDDKTAPLLESAGFELHSETTSSGRRLAAGHEVVGWFNTFAKLTEDLIGIPQSATFPEGDHSYVMTRYERCGDECYGEEEEEEEEGSSSSASESSAADDTTYNPSTSDACPVLSADAERNGKAILYGAVTINGVDYRKETVTTQVKTVNGVAVTRTSTTLDRFPGHVLVQLAAGKQARTFQTYGGAMYHCADPNAKADSSSNTEEEAASGSDAGSDTSAATEAEIQAALLGADEGKVSMAYEGAATLPGHTGELRKYTMTTTAALAVSAGFGTVIIYDDTTSPVRLEIPAAGVIVDISNVQTAPDMDDALFELPTCPTGTTANPTPDMNEGGIGSCVQDDAEDPWDASEMIPEEDGGDFGDEISSGTLRRLSDLEGLDVASLGKLAQELNDEEQHGARKLLPTATTGVVRGYGHVRIAAFTYSRGTCFGEALQWKGRENYVELRMQCDGHLHNNEVYVKGGVTINFYPGQLRTTYARDTMWMRVKTMTAVATALESIQQEATANPSAMSPYARHWLNVLVNWSNYYGNARSSRSWTWSTLISGLIQHRMQRSTFVKFHCVKHLRGNYGVPEGLVHDGHATTTIDLGALYGKQWWSDRIIVFTRVAFTDLNKCWTNFRGGSTPAKSGVLTTIFSRVTFAIQMGSLNLQRTIVIPRRQLSDSAGECYSEEPNKQVALDATLGSVVFPQTMTTSDHQCNANYATGAAARAAFNSRDFATAVDFHFGTSRP